MEILEQETGVDQMPVTFTHQAIEEIKKIVLAENVSEQEGLRIGVKGGGCSGMSYVMGFDLKQEGDDEFLIGDVKILVHKTHQMYLSGMQIDYGEGLNTRGFVFHNPNATKTCGCGSSFSA